MQCPKCNGEMWDNTQNKRNPKAPDFKCKDETCKWKQVKGQWVASEWPTGAWLPSDRSGAMNNFNQDMKSEQIQDNIDNKNKMIEEAQKVRQEENDKLIAAIDRLTAALQGKSQDGITDKDIKDLPF